MSELEQNIKGIVIALNKKLSEKSKGPIATQDIKDTLSKSEFKSKSHARQSQIINLIHQRVRAAYGKAKDSEVKARLKRGLDYIESRKEASKEKTKRLNKVKETADPQSGRAAPYGSGYAPFKNKK